jgi:hypothetical protein
MSKGEKKIEIYGSDIRGGSSMKGGPWTGGRFLPTPSQPSQTYVCFGLRHLLIMVEIAIRP